MVERYGREQVAADVAVGLRSPDELREMFGDAAPSYRSTMIWPTLHVPMHAGIFRSSPDFERVAAIYEGVTDIFFNNTHLVASGFKPVSLLLIVDPNFFKTEGEKRFQYVNGRFGLQQSVSRTIASDKVVRGCGGGIEYALNGTVQFAFAFADPRVLDREGMTGCLLGRFAEASGYRLLPEVAARYTRDELGALAVAAVNAIYACAATESLADVAKDTRVVPNVDLEPFPKGDCIVKTAVRTLTE